MGLALILKVESSFCSPTPINSRIIRSHSATNTIVQVLAPGYRCAIASQTGSPPPCFRAGSTIDFVSPTAITVGAHPLRFVQDN